MDFVVVGLGLGALGVLLGVFMFGVLATLGERAAARATAPEAAARDRALAAEQRVIGHAALAAGTAVLVVTTIALAAALDDRTGALLVTTTVTLAAAGLLYWVGIYRRRHPVPPRLRRTRPSAATVELDKGETDHHDPLQENAQLPDLALIGLDLARATPDSADSDAPLTAGVEAGSDVATARGEIEPISANGEEMLATNAESHPSPENGRSDEEEAGESRAGIAVGSSPRRHPEVAEPASEWELSEDEPPRR